jgi:fatty acid desaturase
MNFRRDSQALNDAAGDWLCAYWVLISVNMFRAPHHRHHGLFGSAADPDKLRFARLGIDRMPRRPLGRLVRFILHVMPTYVLDYWRQFSDKKGQLVKSLAMHVALIAAATYAVGGRFWLLWLIYFWVPFIIYLPVHRFFAEAEEHRYLNAQTEYGSTFSNLGVFQRWFLHPHGDAYHLLHHMLPQVPHWKMGIAHWVLTALDQSYAAGLYRTSVFDEPADVYVSVAEIYL